MRNGARLTVNLEALVANYRYLAEECAPSVCAAAIKANAYGLGIQKVLPALLQAGCETFFVATLEEGCVARQCAREFGYSPIVYVLEGPNKDSMSEFIVWNLHPVLNTEGQIALWREYPENPAAIHLDTGMHRLGMSEADFIAAGIEGLNISLLMTHLAFGSEPKNPKNLQQLKQMQRVFFAYSSIPKSIAHSAGILLGKPYHADLCRPGIGLYGGNPLSGGENPMRSVVTLEGRIIQMQWVPKGTGIGYGASHIVPSEALLATVALGYADGLPRSLSNSGKAYFGDQQCEIVGSISMDLTIVDVTKVAGDIVQGDWLEFLGEHIGIDQMARDCGGFSYEILTGLGLRAEKIYLGEAI
ncbi:MAG: alanine racemase [Pseudomonadales bacterium]|nr:alanine racemase [Pseudomonadales bacterium]